LSAWSEGGTFSEQVMSFWTNLGNEVCGLGRLCSGATGLLLCQPSNQGAKMPTLFEVRVRL